jgi:tetratricopeptide (TPR) repeat protein
MMRGALGLEGKMKIRIFSLLSFAILILSLCAGSAFSQAGRGKARISGVVVDENSKPISSAKVVISLAQTEENKQEMTTNKKGEWAFIGLGGGMWRITVTAEGYLPNYKDVNVSQLSDNPKITIKLMKAAAAGQMQVGDEASLNLLDQANQLYAEKKFDEALASFQQLLEKNPTIYQIHFSIGDCYREKGEFDKAIEEYNKVLGAAQNDELKGKEMTAKALASVGECHLRKGDLESAQKFFKQSIEISPDNEFLAYNIGEINFSNQNIDEAIRFFELAIQIKPDWGPPYLKLGYSYLNKGDFEKAKLNLKKFLEIDPNSPEAANVKNMIDYLEKIKK